MFMLFSEPPLLVLGLPLSPMSFYCLLLKFLGGLWAHRLKWPFFDWKLPSVDKFSSWKCSLYN